MKNLCHFDIGPNKSELRKFLKILNLSATKADARTTAVSPRRLRTGLVLGGSAWPKQLRQVQAEFLYLCSEHIVSGFLSHQQDQFIDRVAHDLALLGLVSL